MRETDKQGNGAVQGEPPLPASGSMTDHGRRMQRDAAALAAEVRGTTADVERYLTDQVEKRPYIALGAAAGLGYILGGGLRSRLTAVLLGSASRLVTALAAREISSRLSPREFTSDPSKAPEQTAWPQQRSNYET